MKPEDTGKAYDSITHLWTSPDFNRSNGIEQHKRALQFRQQAVKPPSGRALDVGCGCTGRIVDLLLEQGYAAEGVDISGEKIRLARARNPEVDFHHQDICQWSLPGTYDFISAWDSIWHVPLSQQEAVLSKLMQALNPGGVFIFSCGALDEPNEHRDDFMGPEVYYASLGINGFLDVITANNCLCRHFEYDQYPELHAYFIVQKR